ncbi:MAG: hypothetical protein ACK5IB_02780 [Qingshengfaniella sp.]
MDHIRKWAARLEDSGILERTVASTGILVGLLTLFGAFALWIKIPVVLACLVLAAYPFLPLIARGYGLDWLIGKDWYSYHLTHDHAQARSYWVEGQIVFSPTSTQRRLSATHRDTRPARHSYRMTGYIRNGAMLFFEENENTQKKDDCLAYFPSLGEVRTDAAEGTILPGFWMGPDQLSQTVAAPYILSTHPLDNAQLGRIAAKLTIVVPKGPDDTYTNGPKD